MGYHEDRYIDYLAENESGFLGGDPERGLSRMRDVGIIGHSFLSTGLRNVSSQLPGRQTVMAKKTATATTKKTAPAKPVKLSKTDKRIAAKEAKRAAKTSKKIAKLQKEIDKRQAKIDKLRKS